MSLFVDLPTVHGVLFAGSARGYTDAAVIAAVTVFGVLPAVAAAIDDLREMVRRGGRSWIRRGILLGELATALVLLNASRRLFDETICVHIAGEGPARVLAVDASAPTECFRHGPAGMRVTL